MTEEEFQQALSRNPDLKKYVDELEMERPDFHVQLDRNMGKEEYPNLIYPVGDPIFIHVFRRMGERKQYFAIEPHLTDRERKLYERVNDELIRVVSNMQSTDTRESLTDVLLKLLDRIIEVKGSRPNTEKEEGIVARVMESLQHEKISMSAHQYERLKYFLIRDRVGFGILEPLLRDPYIEDIHCVGVGNIFIIHKVFEALPTNIVFQNDVQLDQYIFQSSERVERPVSEVEPVVDAIMPDGSRVNFIFGRELSLEGSSFTIRKFSKVPISVTQLVNWHTISAEMAAYLWLCLENGMSIFMCGETASGKTTSLNAISAFIKPDAKLYSVENTPEVTMPHETWQHLVTRESGKDTDVEMFDLLKAALRSRPNYIIVGEIRGEEGNVAFQAMQTGHPVISTFHAGSVRSMIQRLTGHPINVPIASVDNLNVVMIQQAVYHGGRFVRRALSINELIKYYDELGKVGTATVFEWVPSSDEFVFRGFHNSYILEEKIARILGYSDVRDIYDELALRARVIDAMVKNKIFNYYDVWDVIKRYHYSGTKDLPFSI